MSIINILMTCNFKRPAVDILCDLVYYSNGYRIPPPRVKFGTPMELDPRPDIEDDINSYIPAVVDPNFDARLDPNETGFLYTRIPLGAIPMAENTVITPPALPFKTSDILAQINLQLSTQLTMDDLEEDEYTSTDVSVVLRAKATSQVWAGKRFLLVQGIRDNTVLFPNELIYGWLTPSEIGADKKAQLTTFANRDNAANWTRLIDFDFGEIEVSLEGNSGRNSRIFVKSLKDGYKDQWLYFVRVDPKTINDQFKTTPVPEVLVPRGKFTTHEILDRINLTLNLNLTIDDVENTEYLPGLTEYPIRFLKSSLGWLPGVYTMKIVLEELKYFNLRLVDEGRFRMAGPEVYRAYA